MRIYAGSDHAGFSLRRTVVERLRAQGKDVVDLGTDSDTACDYPEFAYAVASKVRSDPGALGILVCATGQGMALAAGKVRGIRAVVPWTIEGARLSRIDNNANVLCLAGRILGETEALTMVDTWLSTNFAGGRHARRIAKVSAIETASAVAFVTESERLQLAARGFPRRLFARDPALFDEDGEQGSKQGAEQAAKTDDHVGDANAAIARNLGWVSLPQTMVDKGPELIAFAEQIRLGRFKDVLLLVEDDQAAPAALCRIWGGAGLRMHVLGADSPAPTSLPDSLHLESTLVVCVSPAAQLRDSFQAQEQSLRSRMLDQCIGNAARAGQHFAAVTSPGGALAQLGELHRYGKVFLEPEGARGAFSGLGFAGLLPAVLAGIDPARILAKATAMAEACRVERLEDNPGATLGLLLGAMAKHGRRKLTLLASRSLEAFGQWISRLLRETVPAFEVLVGEALKPTYPPDRIFVHLQATEDSAAIPPDAMEALHLAGQPYIQLSLAEHHDLGSEIFRWQMAASVAAIVLGPSRLAGPVADSGHAAP